MTNANTYAKTILLLEYIGVQLKAPSDNGEHVSFYFSVPESSTMEVKHEWNDKIKTADGLMEVAKELILHSFAQDAEEFKELSEYFKFFVRVREGEVWTEKHGKERVEEIAAQINEHEEYTEV